MLPQSAVIYLTNECKLKCRHCFIRAKHDNVTNIEYRRLLEVLRDLHDNRVYVVAYTGGDPQLYSHLFDVLQETYNLGMLPVLGLSGTGIDEIFIKKLSLCNIGCVQLSLDGSNEKANSFLRGVGTFAEIINNIKLFKKYNIKINLATCIHEQNYHDYKNILNLFYKLDAYNVKVQFLYKSEKYGLKDISSKQKEEIIKYCKEFEKVHNKNGWIHFENANLTNTSLSKMHSKSFIITSSGNVKLYDDGDILGNIYERLPSQILKDCY